LAYRIAEVGEWGFITPIALSPEAGRRKQGARDLVGDRKGAERAVS
jgi:hypothetical protein